MSAKDDWNELTPRVSAVARVNTLAPLGVAVPGVPPDPAFARLARLARNWQACEPEDRRMIEALALRLRKSVVAAR